MSNVSKIDSTNTPKIIEMLAAGFTDKEVADAFGLSISRINQMRNEPEIANQLADKKLLVLQKHNAIDAQYDTIEDKLAKQLDKVIGLLFKPTEIARTLQIVNQLKRRGAQAGGTFNQSKPVVQLNIPIAIQQKFQVNSANQVVTVEDVRTGETQDLVTIQSSQVDKLSKEHNANAQLNLPGQRPYPSSYREAFITKLAREASGLSNYEITRDIKELPKVKRGEDLISSLGFAD